MSELELPGERDRLRVLFDITTALVSKLKRDDLFTAISDQLTKVIRYDYAVLTLQNRNGGFDLFALPSTGAQPVEHLHAQSPDITGRPAAEALATGKPVVVHDTDLARYPALRSFVEHGLKSACSLPLVMREHPFGALALCRKTNDAWADEDAEFLMEVAHQIALAVENALTYRELAEIKERLASEKLYLEDEIRFDHSIGNMVGEAPAFQSVLRSIQIVAPTDATVLIMGETGTGKELVARAIHELSGRSKGSFVKVNCAAIPASLLESELFGHEKGSFTGAVAQRIGRFELARGGTLFLDEIGEMPLELQPKLLRALQDQEFERVGGSRTIHTDARLVAATNRDLKAMVEENHFRADLYYRLHVFPLNVPPLRDRREDIPLLTRYFVQKHALRMGRNIETIPAPVLEALMKYDWPGNIRELQNVLERSVILSDGNTLQVPTRELVRLAESETSLRRPSAETTRHERERILKALEESHGRVGGSSGAAARLGLKRTTLQSRMRKLGITRQFR